MIEGRVIKIDRGLYWVWINSENEVQPAKLRGRFKKELKVSHSIVNVGDRVELINTKDDWVIEKVLPRRNQISRIDPGNRAHERIIVTNIDQMLILSSIRDPDFNSGLVDRYLVIAEKFEIDPIIIISKVDLISEKEKIYKDILYRFGDSGAVLQPYSYKDSKYREEILSLIRGKTNAIVGSSGVGKSTLINYLDSTINIRTANISDSTSKGKHTTTNVSMYHLNSEDAYIVDTPGIREFGLFDIEPNHLSDYFYEYRDSREQCKFHNCSHTHEPGCAIKEKVESGKLNRERYSGYLNIIESLKNEYSPY